MININISIGENAKNVLNDVGNNISNDYSIKQLVLDVSALSLILVVKSGFSKLISYHNNEKDEKPIVYEKVNLNNIKTPDIFKKPNDTIISKSDLNNI